MALHGTLAGTGQGVSGRSRSCNCAGFAGGPGTSPVRPSQETVSLSVQGGPGLAADLGVAFCPPFKTHDSESLRNAAAGPSPPAWVSSLKTFHPKDPQRSYQLPSPLSVAPTTLGRARGQGSRPSLHPQAGGGLHRGDQPTWPRAVSECPGQSSQQRGGQLPRQGWGTHEGQPLSARSVCACDLPSNPPLAATPEGGAEDAPSLVGWGVSDPTVPQDGHPSHPLQGPAQPLILPTAPQLAPGVPNPQL